MLDQLREKDRNLLILFEIERLSGLEVAVLVVAAQELLVDDATLDADEVAAVMSHMVTTQVLQLRKERA